MKNWNISWRKKARVKLSGFRDIPWIFADLGLQNFSILRAYKSPQLTFKSWELNLLKHIVPLFSRGFGIEALNDGTDALNGGLTLAALLNSELKLFQGVKFP